VLRVNRSVEVYKGILRSNRKVPERYSREIPEGVEDSEGYHSGVY